MLGIVFIYHKYDGNKLFTTAKINQSKLTFENMTKLMSHPGKPFGISCFKPGGGGDELGG